MHRARTSGAGVGGHRTWGEKVANEHVTTWELIGNVQSQGSQDHSAIWWGFFFFSAQPANTPPTFGADMATLGRRQRGGSCACGATEPPDSSADDIKSALTQKPHLQGRKQTCCLMQACALMGWAGEQEGGIWAAPIHSGATGRVHLCATVTRPEGLTALEDIVPSKQLSQLVAITHTRACARRDCL